MLQFRIINCIWNKEELPEQWKESYCTVHMYKKGDKTDCSSSYRGVWLLLTTYKIVSKVLLSRWTPYVDKIIGEHQCGLRHSLIGQIQIRSSAFFK
jgi:hypothetical protein